MDNNNSLLQRALSAIDQLQSQLKLEQTKIKEPIAIVGVSCKFPKSNSLESFWDLLMSEQSAIEKIPSDRWNSQDFHAEGTDQKGKMYFDEFGSIETPFDFDAAFFGISPKEANEMDPQHRLLLELTYQSLENAGITTAQLNERKTGVFVGIGQNDYSLINKDIVDINEYSGTGNGFCFAAGRISHIFGCQGPAIAVDTACSSSLVAIHQAINSIYLNECQQAIVGSSQLILAPDVNIFLSKTQAVSRKGSCSAFSDDADGFVRGEGAAVIIIKKLSQAINDGDHIHAVIRGSAMNHDGKSSGLTVPNGKAQTLLLKKALEVSNIEPTSVSYIETHGTGTKLGDPIEVQAIHDVYGVNRKDPLKIGSVKTNIGHLEAASGMASLIKVLLSFKHNCIPKSLNFVKPNNHFDWKNSTVLVAEKQELWPTDKPKIAGISAFGLSGTNVNMILEEYLHLNENKGDEFKIYAVSLSAKTQYSLSQIIINLKKWLDQQELSPRLSDIVYTLNSCRDSLQLRKTFLVRNVDDLIQQLESNKDIGEVNFKQSQVVFSFTGQGSQYVDMGKQLYQCFSVYRHHFDYCAKIFEELSGESLLDVINNEQKIQQTQYAQVAIFSTGFSLAKLLIDLGLNPSLVMGHSIGEYAAAAISEVFSLKEALTLVYHRGRLMATLSNKGEMWSVFGSLDTVKPILEDCKTISIAAHNEKEQIVLAGDQQEMKLIINKIKELGLVTIHLNVSHAFHSSLMTPILDEFYAIANQINYKLPIYPFISTLTGRKIGKEGFNADYWTQHIRETVKFYDSTIALEKEAPFIAVEIGMHNVLSNMGRKNNGNSKAMWIPTMVKSDKELRTFFAAISALHDNNHTVDWIKIYNIKNGNKLQLPAYTFEQKHFKKGVVPNLKKNQVNIREESYQDKTHKFSRKTSLTIQEDIGLLIKNTLGYHIGEDINQKSIFELGIDSIMTVEIISKIQTKYDIILPKTILFNYPTIESFSDYLEQQLFVSNGTKVEIENSLPIDELLKQMELAIQ